MSRLAGRWRCLAAACVLGCVAVQIPGQTPTPAPAAGDAGPGDRAGRLAELLRRANEALDAGAVVLAESVLREAVALAPTAYYGRRGLGSLLVQTGAYREGVALLAPLLTERPDDALLRNNLAWAHVKAPEPDLHSLRRALQLAEEALILDPASPATRHTLAEIVSASRATPDGPDILRWITGDIEKCRSVAEVFIENKRYGDALYVLDTLMQKTPDDPLLLNNMAWILTTAEEPGLRDIPRALQYAREAVIRLPDSLRIWHTLAESYLAAGEYQTAYRIARECRRAARLQGADDGNIFQELHARSLAKKAQMDIFE